MNINDMLKRIAEIAKQSLIDEVSATPKPGLVDMNNCGSHSDMNIETFIKSANALESYFYDFCVYGFDTAKLSEDSILQEARNIGLDAEKAMYNATGGVNTHKGLIFSLGLICVAIGRLLSLNREVSVENICELVANIVKGICKNDYSKPLESSSMTNGEKIYKEYGIRGSRGEAESGFETVRNFSFPFIKECIEKGMTKNEALVRTLMKLMSVVNDTNMIKRGGIELAERVKSISEENIYSDFEKINEIDKFFIENNLSPGGSADLLATTWFIYNIEKELKLYF